MGRRLGLVPLALKAIPPISDATEVIRDIYNGAAVSAVIRWIRQNAGLE
jgi:hypothetical protein